MKKLSLLLLLALSICSLHAQLDQKLGELTNKLNALYTQLQPQAPIPAPPPAPEPPKPEPVQATIETWDQLVQENNKRKAESKSLSLYNIAVQLHVTADAYQPIKDLQQAIETTNQDLQKKMREQSCGKNHPKFHMTLLYLNIPIDLSNINTHEGQNAEIKAVYNNVTSWIETISWAHNATGLKSIKLLSFDYTGLKIIRGKDYDFLVALFNPQQGILPLQKDLILPLAKEVFQKYPHAWIEFLEHLEYHISLAFFQKSCNITDAEIKPPAAPTTLAPFELKTGELKVVIKGIDPQTIPWPL